MTRGLLDVHCVHKVTDAEQPSDLSHMICTVVDKLLRSEVLDEQAAARVREQLNQGRPFGEALRLNGISEEKPLRFLAKELRLVFVELESRSISKEFLSQFNSHWPLPDDIDNLVVSDDKNDGFSFDYSRDFASSSAIFGFIGAGEVLGSGPRDWCG